MFFFNSLTNVNTIYFRTLFLSGCTYHPSQLMLPILPPDHINAVLHSCISKLSKGLFQLADGFPRHIRVGGMKILAQFLWEGGQHSAWSVAQQPRSKVLYEKASKHFHTIPSGCSSTHSLYFSHPHFSMKYFHSCSIVQIILHS